MHDVDTEVLEMFETQLLDEGVIRAAVTEAVRQLRDTRNSISERDALKERLSVIEVEAERLTTAIAMAGRDIPSLLLALRDRERERNRIEANLQHLAILEQANTLDGTSIEGDLRGALVDWRGLLQANIQYARQAIRKLLHARLVVTPNDAHHHRRGRR